jgi:hypothetical protein
MTSTVFSSGTVIQSPWLNDVNNFVYSGIDSNGAPTTVTTDYVVLQTNVWILNNKSGSTLTLTLPAASSCVGKVFTIQNYQPQTVVSNSSNIVPQGGGSAGTTILFNSIGDWATIVSNGNNWVIVQYCSYNNLLLG